MESQDIPIMGLQETHIPSISQYNQTNFPMRKKNNNKRQQNNNQGKWHRNEKDIENEKDVENKDHEYLNLSKDASFKVNVWLYDK